MLAAQQRPIFLMNTLKLIIRIACLFLLITVVSFVGLAGYILFIDEHFLDQKDLKLVRKAYKIIDPGLTIDEVSRIAQERGLTFVVDKYYLEIRKDLCSCRFEYNYNNIVVKKYIPSCEISNQPINADRKTSAE